MKRETKANFQDYATTDVLPEFVESVRKRTIKEAVHKGTHNFETFYGDPEDYKSK